MITKDRHTGNYEATCDKCSSEFFETDTDNFYVAIDIIRRDGWYVFKDEKTDEWTHTCPDCGLA